MEALAAVPVFALAGVCPGYATGWLTDLLGFRKRTVVERIFWSIPLSFSLMGIGGELLGRLGGLNAVVAFAALSAVVCVVLLAREMVQLHRSGQRFPLGVRPLGGRALVAVLVWVVLVILLLTDIGSKDKLYFSLAVYDHSMRVAWTDSVLRTGIPPDNPLFMGGHPAAMRYYYFWYVLCAVVVRLGHLQARAVMVAGCVWAGFLLCAVTGLFLKHFLQAGEHLRKQFVTAVGMLWVTGLGILVHMVDIFYSHEPLPGALEVWKAGQITSWLNSLIWVPHHVGGLACCMWGFLLVWLEHRKPVAQWGTSAAMMGVAFASAFGFSVYVAFAFFWVMVAWSLWQAVEERSFRAAGLLLAGGGIAAICLIPFLRTLLHSSSSVQGQSMFMFDVREMIPPGLLLQAPPVASLVHGDAWLTVQAAKLLLLVPGYAMELGIYAVVLAVYLLPGLRGRARTEKPQRALLCIAGATLILMSFVRSSVIDSNDFGWRTALILEFVLLLLSAEWISTWETEGGATHIQKAVRSVAALALILGIGTTLYQMLMIRFTIPLREMQMALARDENYGKLPRKAFIARQGYGALNTVAPASAVVQYNPRFSDPLWLVPDWLFSSRQMAVDMDMGGCGAEFGGDPKGCAPMSNALDALYRGGIADEARTVCQEFGIGYLVATAYDPAWQRKDGWVWQLPVVVAQPEFRAVRCGE